MTIKKVTLVGANGTLGCKILDALRAEHSFCLSVLRRKSSSSLSTSPGQDINGRNIEVLLVGDDMSTDELAKVLRGQDAVIASFPLRDVGEHLRLVEACALAGVRRFIPADFGSCDAESARAQELLKLYRDKSSVRHRAEELAREYEGFSWTTLTCGHFFDWGLKETFLHFDIPKKKADLLDAGNDKASYSTLGRIAEAVVRVLLMEEKTRNRALFVQSFSVTQREVLAVLEKTTGGKWKIEELESGAFIEEQKGWVKSGNKFAVEELVWALGTVDADWRGREGFAMELLTLEDEDLEGVVARVVAEC